MSKSNLINSIYKHIVNVRFRWLFLIPIFTTIFYLGSSLGNKTFAQSASDESNLQEEHISNYNVNIKILENRDINVEESIIHVKNISHHGIYRDITYTLQKKYGIDYKTKIKIRKVEAYNLSENKLDKRASSYITTDQGDFLRVRIGSSDYEIQGPYRYDINYTVEDVIRDKGDFDEFFWNVIPHYWDMPINKIDFTISAPFEIKDYKCFIGSYGSTDECELTIDGSTAKLATPVSLENEEGVTVALAFPPNLFKKLTGIRQIIDFIFFFCPLFLIIPVFLFMHLIWLKYGKDEKPKTVYPHYEPPDNLDPLMGGYVYKQKVEPKYITALLIDLAVKGYIKIEKTTKKGLLSKKDEFILHRTNKTLENIPIYARTLIEGIFQTADPGEFSKSLKDLKSSKFYETISDVKKEVIEEAERLGFMDKVGNKLSQFSSIAIGISVPIGLFICTFIYGLVSEFLGDSPTAGFFVIFLVTSAVIVGIYSYIMKKRSKRGTEIYGELLGLKMYIETAEIDKIKFHNDPKKYSGIYETLLPYSIVFGLEKKWAKKFKDLYINPPDWYNSNDTAIFNSYVLASSISDSFASSISSTYSPPASSSSSGFGGFSGGGFSGGGGGGGGGGSW